MEILRFEESETPAPKRKRASKGWVALGLVASLMGVSTAFASSTININGNNLTPLGQGVSTATACDNSITITPNAGLTLPTEDTNTVLEELKPSFTLAGITISGIDYSVPNPETGAGCLGVDFKIQVFKNQPTGEDQFQAVALTCSQLNLVNVDSTISECTGDAIYFRDANASHVITLSSTSDFDYITLVSTHHEY